MKRLLIAIACCAGPLSAQETEPKFQSAPEGVIYSESQPEYVEEIIREERPESRSEPKPLAVLRGLDKVSGLVTELRIPAGGLAEYGRLLIEVLECRAPPEEEGEDAFVFLRIIDRKAGDLPVFSGWMFASSPALSAMDHQRYDVWALSCATS